MRNQQYFTMILKLFMLLLQMKLIFSVPIETEVSEDEASRAATDGAGLPNPIEGLQQIFNPSSGSSGRPMAVLGTFQTIFMPMPSWTEGIQQGQAIINGMNTLGSVFKPIVDGVQSIQQG